jgi:ABC-type molybdate transport system substrate-binding protein
MARTAITVQQLTGPYPATPFAPDALTFAAMDVGNKNDFVFTGNELIIIYNSDATTARTIIFTAVADPYKRTNNITVSVAAETYRIYQATDITGWLQSDGKFYLEGDNVALKVAVVRLK